MNPILNTCALEQSKKTWWTLEATKIVQNTSNFDKIIKFPYNDDAKCCRLRLWPPHLNFYVPQWNKRFSRLGMSSLYHERIFTVMVDNKREQESKRKLESLIQHNEIKQDNSLLCVNNGMKNVVGETDNQNFISCCAFVCRSPDKYLVKPVTTKFFVTISINI